MEREEIIIQNIIERLIKSKEEIKGHLEKNKCCIAISDKKLGNEYISVVINIKEFEDEEESI